MSITIPQSIHVHLTHLIASNFTTDEINSLGKYLAPKFNAHIVSGEPFGITLRPDTAASAIVKYFAAENRIEELIILIFHLPENATIVHRPSVTINGLDEFKNKMIQAGLIYDPKIDRITVKKKDEDETWPGVEEGMTYPFSFLSIDIAGNSVIQSRYPQNEIEYVYQNLFNLLLAIVRKYNGRVWTWAGDGGIIAFYGDEIEEHAVQCAIEIQLSLLSFNLATRKNLFKEPIYLRVAAHAGPTLYKENKGAILSEAINYVAHLEKNGTTKGGISISKVIFDGMNSRLKKVFQYRGEFEGIDTYAISLHFNWMEW